MRILIERIFKQLKNIISDKLCYLRAIQKMDSSHL
jgi:hypothetical protein